jgi:two-component sensor histidine kinase
LNKDEIVLNVKVTPERGRGPIGPAAIRSLPVFQSREWTKPTRSIRGGLLITAIVTVAPLVAFASGMALLKAYTSTGLNTAVAWVTAAAAPVLIGVAAILILSVAVEAMVMQWLTYLQRLSRAYARGRYSVRPNRLLRAPLEFRSLGLAVSEMAAAIEHRDQALREALEEQTVLTREVHHRVKNNLQIVGSLLSLQAARSPDPAVRHALQDALIRIDAMSLTQRFMQQKEEDDHVSSLELFESFAVQLRARLGPDRGAFVLLTDVQDQVMPLDVGSRLILVTAEALIAAFAQAQGGALSCVMRVRFEGHGVELTLIAQDSPDAFAAPDEVSRPLIDGYVRQLHGQLLAPAGTGELRVRAPIRA